MEPDRGQEGKEGRRCRRWRSRQSQRRQDAGDGCARLAGAARPSPPALDSIVSVPPPFREESNREPIEAVKALLAAGANPNAKAPDGATLMHQAVQARQVAIVRALAGAGAKFDAVNKDNLTPLQLAEKPEPPPPPGNNTDSRTYRPKRDSREDVIAAVRELMGLGPNDPTPQPPPRASVGETRRTRRRLKTTRPRAWRRLRQGRTRDGTMKKVLLSAALVWAGAAVLWAQAGTAVASAIRDPGRPTVSVAARKAASLALRHRRHQPEAAVADQTAKYQAWVKQYCITVTTAARRRRRMSRSIWKRPASRTCCRSRRRGSACFAS